MLLKNTKNNKQFFYFEKNVQTYLHENLVNDFENSIIVCSTHEKTSEEVSLTFLIKVTNYLKLLFLMRYQKIQVIQNLLSQMITKIIS